MSKQSKAWKYPSGMMSDSGEKSGAPELKAETESGSADFCTPTQCPICKKSVFRVAHKGGQLWLDSLNPPWFNHSCSDISFYIKRLRSMSDEDRTEIAKFMFGVIISSHRNGQCLISCSDATVRDLNLDHCFDSANIAGSLVVVEQRRDGGFTVRLV